MSTNGHHFRYKTWSVAQNLLNSSANRFSWEMYVLLWSRKYFFIIMQIVNNDFPAQKHEAKFIMMLRSKGRAFVWKMQIPHKMEKRRRVKKFFCPSGTMILESWLLREAFADYSLTHFGYFNAEERLKHKNPDRHLLNINPELFTLLITSNPNILF